jgi:23S rRNA (cytidine1920-2'-O)/16S rRNA (cytidine1409-2'-O)-methyltransferase
VSHRRTTGSQTYVGRAGDKLAAALDAFALDVAGWLCADFGANVGGFTDCLLQHAAAKVYAVDTGYGALAWKLRRDARVVVMERTNALYCPVPQPVDLVAVDVGWTPQHAVIPAALRWLRPGGRIVSLLKPHYELAKSTRAKPTAVISDDQAAEICRGVCDRLGPLGAAVRDVLLSPLRGKGGNVEYLLHLAPA